MKVWAVFLTAFAGGFVSLQIANLLARDDVTACLLSTNYDEPGDGLATVYFACYERT